MSYGALRFCFFFFFVVFSPSASHVCDVGEIVFAGDPDGF